MSLEGGVVKVRYKLGWSVTFLVLGGLSLALVVVMLIGTGKVYWGSLIPGVLCTVVGVGYRTRPYFEVHDDHLLFRAVIGPAVKRFAYASPSELEVREGKLWLKGKKLGLSRTLARREDWEAFVARVQAASTFD